MTMFGSAVGYHQVFGAPGTGPAAVGRSALGPPAGRDTFFADAFAGGALFFAAAFLAGTLFFAAAFFTGLAIPGFLSIYDLKLSR